MDLGKVHFFKKSIWWSRWNSSNDTVINHDRPKLPMNCIIQFTHYCMYNLLHTRKSQVKNLYKISLKKKNSNNQIL